jgi:hypothetical protein
MKALSLFQVATAIPTTAGFPGTDCNSDQSHNIKYLLNVNDSTDTSAQPTHDHLDGVVTPGTPAALANKLTTASVPDSPSPSSSSSSSIDGITAAADGGHHEGRNRFAGKTILIIVSDLQLRTPSVAAS